MDVIVRERNEHITAHAPREETTAGREIEQNSPLYTTLRREVSSQVLQLAGSLLI